MTYKPSMALLAAVLVTGCTTVTTREPICEPPPIPPELLLACEEPMVPDQPGFAAMYDSYIRNVAGPWSRCIRKDDQLIAIVKYRDAVCAKIRADNAQPKHWWNF